MTDSKWAQNLFVSKAPYNRMTGAIRRQQYEWQYFEGMAFLTTYTQIQYDIMAEAAAAIEELRNEMRDEVDLIKKIDEKIKEYENYEYQLYHTLLSKLKLTGSPSWVLPAHDATIQQKINSWDYLFLAPILDRINSQSGQNGGIVLENDDALYCFLMSTELYDELKSSSFLRTRLSRHDWERAYTGQTSKYDQGRESDEAMRELEEEFYQAFTATRNADNSIRKAIYNAMDAALSDATLGLELSEKTRYLNIINRSYGELVTKVKKNPAQNTDYKYIHDELKQWGLETLKDINRRIASSRGKDAPQIQRVEVGNNNVTFFLIEQTGTASDATSVSQTIRALITDYLKKMISKGKSFELTSLRLGNHIYSIETAKSALKRWESAVGDTSTETAIKNFVQKNKGRKLNSNSVISGVLGELAIYFGTRKFKVDAILTGGKEQRYRYGERKNKNGTRSDASLIGEISLAPNATQGEINYAKSFKSTGQFFSDMQLADEFGELTGINIKRYITDETSFTLTSAQSKGLSLGDRQLRRYLSEKEIILLTYLQSNYAILRDYAGTFPSFPFSIEDAAKDIMDNNLTNILRITSAGFNTTNYIIAANGHFIPASCILQYARRKLQDALKKGKTNVIYDIYNTAPLPYVTRKITPRTIGDTEDGSVNDAKIDVAKLRYIEIAKNARTLAYRFKDFKVSINQLLKL